MAPDALNMRLGRCKDMRHTDDGLTNSPRCSEPFTRAGLCRPDKAIRDNDVQEYMENARNTMDPRLRDIIISVAAFAVFLILIAILPMFLSTGIAYLAAVIVFIVVMAAAGLRINQTAK
jgi:hypothetical protein